MEGDPHRLLEAVLLAAYAAGASHGVVYVHGEAELSAERLTTALSQARAWGLVGPRVLGADFSLERELRRGAGGFVLGEETALLESLEGRRAMPRTRPPFPVESGLFGRPTVINNVETLCAVPPIVERGGAWFAGLGGGRGTKLFGLSGRGKRAGIVHLELRTPPPTLLHATRRRPPTPPPLPPAVRPGRAELPGGVGVSWGQWDPTGGRREGRGAGGRQGPGGGEPPRHRAAPALQGP